MARQMPRRNQDGVETHSNSAFQGVHQPGLRALICGCWRGVTAKAGLVEAGTALTSTKAIRLRRLATTSISPCGVRKAPCEDAITLGH